jgi:2-oxoglutarate dehydrogenase E2 component (dihydrolipoamide succinyltransferase)
MTTDIKVPTLGESVTEATVGQWFKKEGDAVTADEPVVELETDKVTLEVPAPATGTLASIAVKDGETVGVGALLGSIGEGAAAPVAPAAKPTAAGPEDVHVREPVPETDMPASPAAAKLMVEKGLAADQVSGTGKRGQVLKGDVLVALEKTSGETAPAAATSIPAAPAIAPAATC